MKRIAIYTHSACLAHDTGPAHVECGARLTAVTYALRSVPGLEWHDAPRAARVPFAQWNSKNRFGKRCVLRQEPSEVSLKMQAPRVDTVMLIRIHFGRIGTSPRRLKCTRVEERRI